MYFTSGNEPDGFEMQPTIHFQSKLGHSTRPYPGSLSKCIVGCIFNSLGLIITREIPSMYYSSHVRTYPVIL
jgi:hypothetical protein